MDPTPEPRPERLPSDLDSLTPSAISFEEIHRRTRIAAAMENGWRLRMAFDLLFIEEAAFQRPGGSSSVQQYAESHYGRSHDEALSMIRVAKESVEKVLRGRNRDIFARTKETERKRSWRDRWSGDDEGTGEKGRIRPE